MGPSHISPVKSNRDAPGRKNGKAEKEHCTLPPSKGMKFMNELLPGHFKSMKRTNGRHSGKLEGAKKPDNILPDELLFKKCEAILDRIEAAERRQQRDSPVPMVSILNVISLHLLEQRLGKSLENIEFNSQTELGPGETEWEVRALGGIYYCKPESLARQIHNYALSDPKLNISLENPKRMRRFLCLIRDGASREKAAAQLKEEEAARPRKTRTNVVVEA